MGAVNCLVNVPTFIKISCFVFNRRKKHIKGWNNLRVMIMT